MAPSPELDLNPRHVELINRGSPALFVQPASQKFRTQTARSIQLLSEKDQKLQTFRK